MSTVDFDDLFNEDSPLYPDARSAPDDGIFFATETARCSRAGTPRGRLILARTGLYFIPGSETDVESAVPADPWLGGALTDDARVPDNFGALRGRSPEAQVAAVAGALHLESPALAHLALSRALLGDVTHLEDGSSMMTNPVQVVELAVTLSADEHLVFTLIDTPNYERIVAWRAAVAS